MNVTERRALVWLYIIKDLEGLNARRFEKLEPFKFKKRHNEGKDVPHADCLSRVQTEKGGILTFAAASTKIDTGIEKETNFPWQVLQDTF